VTGALPRLALPVALVVLNTAAHFLPLERASVGPDDYAYLVRYGSGTFGEILQSLETERQRPLQLVALGLQARLVGGGRMAAFLLPYLSSSLLLLAAFSLLRALLVHETSAFVAATLLCLLPQTVEIHHTAMYFNVNVALALWCLCAAVFLRYLRDGGPARLVLAVLLYAVGLFWYEIGFFIPLVFLAWGRLLRSPRLFHVLWFGPIAVAYFVYGHTSLLGVAPAAFGHALGWDAKPLLHLLSFAAGPHAARAVAYGLFSFVHIEAAWLVVIVLVDVTLVYVFYTWLKTRDYDVDSHAWWMTAALAAGFLLPFAVQAKGGIAGRHLVVPAMALVVFALRVVRRAARWRTLLVAGAAAALVVAQGNAWAQVVACRINRAVYEALRVRGDAVRSAGHVVIDLHSFTDRIPYTWLPVPFDRLNSYYGAQTFEDWGLLSMTRLAARDRTKTVHLAVESPVQIGDEWRFVEGQDTGSRAFQTRPATTPRTGTLVIGFGEVFGREFRNGRGLQ
jgi:hypothetical protein